jgi:hypothetical protein
MASGYGLAGGTYYQPPCKLERVCWRRQWHERNGNGTINGECGTNATQRDTTPAANREQEADSADLLSLYGGLYYGLVVSCKQNTRSSTPELHHHETESTKPSTLRYLAPCHTNRFSRTPARPLPSPHVLTRPDTSHHLNPTYHTILTHQPSRPIPLLPLLARSPRMLRNQHIRRRQQRRRKMPART